MPITVKHIPSAMSAQAVPAILPLLPIHLDLRFHRLISAASAQYEAPHVDKLGIDKVLRVPFKPNSCKSGCRLSYETEKRSQNEEICLKAAKHKLQANPEKQAEDMDRAEWK
ncbi:hypothetical protein Q9966_001647 [Columba livia]|nr:hypothetical protein Q9966_001647 [Columba livia]